MKSCPNCRVIYNDDYSGTCNECGAPMGGVTSPSQSLAARYANQRRRAEREAGMEQQFRNNRGNARPGDVYDRAPMDQAIVDVARRFIIVPEEAKDG